MFIPCIERMLQNVVRIDIAWDIYKEDSLKAQMRERLRVFFFHAVTGCDTVSAFHNIEMKTTWALLKSIPHLYKLFANLFRTPREISPAVLEQLERFVIVLYQRIPSINRINEARKQLFTHN